MPAPPPPLPPPRPITLGASVSYAAPVATLVTDPSASLLVFHSVCASIQNGAVPPSVPILQAGPGWNGAGTTLIGTISVSATPWTYSWGNSSPDGGDPCGTYGARHTYTQVSGESGNGPSGGVTIRAHRTLTVTASGYLVALVGGTGPPGPILVNGQPALTTAEGPSSGPHLIEQLEAIPVTS